VLALLTELSVLLLSYLASARKIGLRCWEVVRQQIKPTGGLEAEKGLRAIQANYVLKDGETERLLCIHSRVQHRISKWLDLLAQSKADRFGLTITQPLETNGQHGDGALE